MKTIYHNISVALVLGGLVGMTSCGKDFLKEDQITIPDTEHFKTQQGIDDLATGTYAKLKFKFNYTWGMALFNLGVDEFTDANNPSPSFNSYSTDLNASETTYGGNNIAPFWDNMYSGIESANTLIQNVPLYYDQSSVNYNTRLGEGHFMRGYFYLQLIAQFGGVPLKLTPSTGVETYFTRATEEEVFAQVIADLEKAYDLLPPTVSEFGRVTKWAAAHYLAKAHLTRASELYSSWNTNYISGDLDSVIRYGTEVVNAHPLVDDFIKLWDYQVANGANEKVSEVVLSAQFSDDQATWGRYGNQIHLYYPSVYQDLAGTSRDISGGREFSYARATNYTMDVFDRVNDSRFWKSFITMYGCNNTNGAPVWTETNAPLGPVGTVAGTKRFRGGELAIKYIVNNAGDSRYTKVPNDNTGVLKDGVMQNTHTFVRYFNGEAQAWVGQHGNNGYFGVQSRSVALSKFRDGYRVSIASQFGTRDAIMARSAEDVLMVAEAYIRKGEAGYPDAILWINKLRERAGYKSGEDRSKHVDGGQAYKNNSYAVGKGGGYSADGAVYWERNSYYESNNDMEQTTAPTSIILTSVNDIYNSPVDKPIYEKLGATTNAQKMMCFLLNERTRELCGELHRWEDLARTRTLEARWKAFNDGYTRGNTVFSANTHYYRPIPQSFLDAITNQSGSTLSPSEKQAMQNPGY
ncbi:putative outer membrane starch-binding protein [Sphingobacterium allocomposti]|uniref:Putative outer membrane starch-binding protein n=1 Tax=Sphingobacterium allocomposti TaxID=415956 RepID=A0A5S5DRM1_9SPHI|nr:RagB/SusD family nutrient uptake outer membrane protein [Sphingobacterium composti Yoo et al. 2007 non Ten et al. 2007]TYP98415.1 putative outer membrane starch-binding protein [Sphingobacterium composti Yoo et al. 2007 non Ten et al. 2007]